MQRVTLTIDDALLAAVDAYAERHGYATRSEAVRDALRAAFAAPGEPVPASERCYAALSYVYDHDKRELARRLTEVQHDHHDLAVASLHVHLDHDSCLEVAVLRGPTRAVRQLADAVITQRGVRYGHLHIVPPANHEHGPGHDHDHSHAFADGDDHPHGT